MQRGVGAGFVVLAPSGLAVSAAVKNPASGPVTKVQLAGFSQDYPNELAYGATLGLRIRPIV